jgi:hypothetical protein
MPRNLEPVVVFLSTRSSALSVFNTLIISFKKCSLTKPRIFTRSEFFTLVEFSCLDGNRAPDIAKSEEARKERTDPRVPFL